MLHSNISLPADIQFTTCKLREFWGIHTQTFCWIHRYQSSHNVQAFGLRDFYENTIMMARWVLVNYYVQQSEKPLFDGFSLDNLQARGHRNSIRDKRIHDIPRRSLSGQNLANFGQNAWYQSGQNWTKMPQTPNCRSGQKCHKILQHEYQSGQISVPPCRKFWISGLLEVQLLTTEVNIICTTFSLHFVVSRYMITHVYLLRFWEKKDWATLALHFKLAVNILSHLSGLFQSQDIYRTMTWHLIWNALGLWKKVKMN